MERIDCWQQPWKFIYEGCAEGKWYSGRCDEELSDSDESFEVLLGSPDRMLDKLRVSTPTWEEQMEEAQRKVNKSESTALKGIPGPLEEPDGQEDSAPAAQVAYTLPRVAEVCTNPEGGESSVLANLIEESDGQAAEVQAFPCNPKVTTPVTSSVSGLSPLPTVSCRVTQLVRPSSAYSGKVNKLASYRSLG